jgi:hypothetical protein|tara:strand:+ start:44 stop:313 length:270 start_codon:yes stop_codon:yes gene_type:complete
MRLTEQDKNTLKETHDKWLNEAGWLAKLFIKRAAKDIKKNKTIQNAIADADKFTQQSKNKISNLFNGDKEKIKKALPDKILRKSLGFDF